MNPTVPFTYKAISGLFILSLMLFLLACSSKPNNKSVIEKVPDPFETALPHGSSLPQEALSAEDKLKLERANGRQVDSLSVDQLEWMLDSLNTGLNIISFWSLDCADCLKTNQHLIQLTNSGGDSLYKLLLINLDDGEFLPQVNASIRAQGTISDCYMLQQDSLLQWTGKIQSNWDGSLPALFLLNPEEGIRLFYPKAFTPEELQALLQPFML